MQGYVVSGALVTACPACRTRCEDALELLGVDAVHAVHCEACSRRYFVVLKECLGCGSESAFVSPWEPAAPALAALLCGACGRAYGEPQEDAGDA
jgi:hypothetical protein